MIRLSTMLLVASTIACHAEIKCDEPGVLQTVRRLVFPNNGESLSQVSGITRDGVDETGPVTFCSASWDIDMKKEYDEVVAKIGKNATDGIYARVWLGLTTGGIRYSGPRQNPASLKDLIEGRVSMAEVLEGVAVSWRVSYSVKPTTDGKFWVTPTGCWVGGKQTSCPQ
jgi:hypothetical protein